jgi:hypothetical protein
LARKAARWTNDNIEYLKSEPNMPAALDGRRGDNWRHLLAIADAARGSWPTVARKAAEVMVADDDNQFAGILLLQDIKAYFEQHKTDRVLSEVLAETLKEMLDRPWPEWKSGKPITQREIAKLLGTFDADGVAKIKTRDVRDGDKRAKGYLSEQFNDAFRRYLPSQSPVSPISSATPRQLGDSNDLEQAGTVTNRKNVTDKMTANRLKNNDCCGVADKKGESGNEEVCDRCGRPAKPGSPLVRVSVAGVDSFGHESCISPPEFPPTSPENQRLNS